MVGYIGRMVVGFTTTISNRVRIYHGGQVYWWRKPKYPEKTTNPSLTKLIT
jgi:hypothetical protein